MKCKVCTAQSQFVTNIPMEKVLKAMFAARKMDTFIFNLSIYLVVQLVG